jgi:beta-glucanase (GH16 family)
MAEWHLAHEEVFSRTGALDRGFWDFETGFIRNRELQYYAPGNVAVRDGVLSLQARRERVPNAAHVAGSGGWRTRAAGSRFTSGAIVTREPLHYGRVEVVARSPAGRGMWPALWLLHESAGQYGEIDVFEAVGRHPETAWAGVHWGRGARTRRHRDASLRVPGMEGAWRTHVLEWTPEVIRVLFDGRELFRFDPADAQAPGIDPLRRPMRLHVNLALGGTWGGPLDESRLPASFDVASIRVWRWPPHADAAPTDAATGPAVPRPAPIVSAIADSAGAPAREPASPAPFRGRE